MFIRDRILPEPVHTYWIVENPRTHLYWCDPYHVRTSGVDWGPYHRAWRFPSDDVARTLMKLEHVSGVLREIPLP